MGRERATYPRRARRWAVGLPAVALLVGTLLLVPALHQDGAGGATRAAHPSPATRGPAWALTGPLRTHRFALAATWLRDGRVLVVGGDSALGGDLLSSELYDPGSGRWAVSGALRYGRVLPVETLLPDGRVLVVGGTYVPAGARTAETYDPRTGRWSLTRPLAVPIARPIAAATVLRGGVVLVIGDGAAQTFDPRTGRWTDLHVRPGTIAVYPHAAILLPDGRVLVVNGRTTDPYGRPDAVLYDPRTGRWTPTGRMPPDSGTTGEAVTPLRDGRVLVVGGTTADDPPALAGVSLYDPRTSRWTRAASPRQRRTQAVAATLPDGRVLLAGGGLQNNLPSAVSACDLYDPRTNRWTATVALHTPRTMAAGALLADGRYLVVGGTAPQNFLGGSGTRFTSDPLMREAEVFTP